MQAWQAGGLAPALTVARLYMLGCARHLAAGRDPCAALKAGADDAPTPRRTAGARVRN